MFYLFVIIATVTCALTAEDDYPETAQLQYNYSNNNITGIMYNLPQAQAWELTLTCRNVNCINFTMTNATNTTLIFHDEKSFTISGTDTVNISFSVQYTGINDIPQLRITNQNQEEEYLSFGCLNDVLQLTCPERQTIWIRKVLYGNHGKDDRNCAPAPFCFESKPDEINATCTNSTTCKVTVEETVLACSTANNSSNNLLIMYSCNDATSAMRTTMTPMGTSGQVMLTINSSSQVTDMQSNATGTTRSLNESDLATVTGQRMSTGTTPSLNESDLTTVTSQRMTPVQSSTSMNDQQVTTRIPQLPTSSYASKSTAPPYIPTSTTTAMAAERQVDNLGMIIGLSAGGAILLMLGIITFVCICRKKSSQKNPRNKFQSLSYVLPHDSEILLDPVRGEAIFTNKYEEIDIIHEQQKDGQPSALLSFKNPTYNGNLEREQPANGEGHEAPTSTQNISMLYAQVDKKNKGDCEAYATRDLLAEVNVLIKPPEDASASYALPNKKKENDEKPCPVEEHENEKEHEDITEDPPVNDGVVLVENYLYNS